MTNREPIFDVAKSVAMYCVIAGHIAAQGLVGLRTEAGRELIANFYVAVNMPTFFMIAGYFARAAFEAGDTNKILTRVIGYFWPVLAFGCVCSVYLAMAGNVSWQQLVSFPLWLIRRLWFVRTLAIVYLVVFAIWKGCKNKWCRCVWLLFAYLCLIVNPARLGMWYLRDVMHMFPYFVFGLLVLRQSWFKDWRIAVPCGVIYIAICLFEGDVRSNGMGFYWVSAYYKDMLLTMHGLLCFFGRTLVGISGCLFIFWLIDIALHHVPLIGRMATFGTTTLGIYVFHETILGKMGGHWPLPLPYNWRWLIAVLLFLFFHYFVVILKHYRLTKFFFFGDSAFISSALNKIRIKST